MTKGTPKISVIMPVYNAEAHLEESIESFLGQRLRECELICVDDGSVDSSPEILASFQEKDARVRILTQENLGAGPARNLALAETRSEYVAFLDSDDRYPDEHVLEMLYELAERHRTKVAGGSLLFLDERGLSPAKLGSVDFGFREEAVIEYHDLQQAYYYQRFIYSREMLMSAGIDFPPYRRFQDVVFFVRAMLEAGPIAVIDCPSYVYRKSSNFAELSDAQINDMLLGYVDVLELANEHGLDELRSFLSARLDEGSAIQRMIGASIERGNETARKRYDAATTLAESSLPKKGAGEQPMGFVRKAIHKLSRIVGS